MNYSKSKNELSSVSGTIASTTLSSANLNLGRGKLGDGLLVKDVIDEKDKEGDEVGSGIDKNEALENVQPVTVVPVTVIRAPRRIVNPYDEFLKEQERILQARKEAKEKYTKISATQNQTKKSQPLKFIIKEGNNHWII